MTYNEKKDYLSKYRLQQARIGRITEMMKTYPHEEERYRRQLLDARFMRDKIEEEIASVGDEVLVELLSQKYMCGKSISEIALSMNYSKRQIERLHIKALNTFETT